MGAPAPVVVTDAPSVMVLPVLATPVPPYWPATSVPAHVPEPMVPTVVSEDVTTPEASVVPVIPLAGTAAAVIDVLQPKPVLVVQFSALLAVEHDPTARALTLAIPDVALPRTVFVAICATLPRVMPLVALWKA